MERTCKKKKTEESKLNYKKHVPAVRKKLPAIYRETKYCSTSRSLNRYGRTAFSCGAVLKKVVTLASEDSKTEF